ncbi:MAG: hypothetical protein ACE3JQ_03545 [Paenisporosarcina sp.]
MKKNYSLFSFTLLFFPFFLSGCNQPPQIDISEALMKTEENFREDAGIDCVSAFDGETVKFRLFLKNSQQIRKQQQNYLMKY